MHAHLPDPRIVVIIPAYNEEASLGEVVTAIRRDHQLPVFVVDDASGDNTRQVARQAGATVIPLAVQLGAWGATQAGIRHALALGYEVAVSMDADGQHRPASLPALLQPVLSGEADVSIGACTERGSRLRKLAWRLMKASSGLRLEDLTSGFRVYNLAALHVLAGWRATLLDYQDVGVLLLLQSRGLRLRDVPIAMQSRVAGASRVFHSWLTVIHYMLYTLLLGVAKYPLRRSRKASTPET